MSDQANKLVEVRGAYKSFGGVHAVEDVSLNLYPGEVVGILGHNGAGKSTLIKCLSGAHPIDAGDIFIEGNKVDIRSPRDARAAGLECIYQTLALADNLNAPANLFLGRELTTRWGTVDDEAMEIEARKVLHRLNPHFTNINDTVSSMSGGQRQSVAIARAILFNARILIMDEPTAALGPQETRMVSDLITQLKKDGIGIFLISHDLNDVFELSDRLTVMKNGKQVGTYRTCDVTQDQVLAMIISGAQPRDVAQTH